MNFGDLKVHWKQWALLFWRVSAVGHASAALTAQVWAERKKTVVDPGLGIYLANLMKRQRSMEIKELEGLLKTMEPRLDREG